MIKEFTKGIFKENPLFIIVLGLCPALAVSTEVINAIGMGAGVIFVLLGSNICVSLLKNFIPEKVRIPSYIVIIASFVTIVEMVMEAYTPDLYKNLGIFVSLIVVNCVILGRAEAYASKKSLVHSILDALGMGIGFTLGLLLIATIREIFGAGTITLFPIKAIGFSGKITLGWLNAYPARVLAFASGALLVMGYLKAFFNWMEERFKNKEHIHAEEEPQEVEEKKEERPEPNNTTESEEPLT
jgi:Na+-translocating ferredoxin:NAD+ oxidoreductase subunit E